MKNLELIFTDADYVLVVNRHKIAIDGEYCDPDTTLEHYFEKSILDEAKYLHKFHVQLKPEEPEACCGKEG